MIIFRYLAKEVFLTLAALIMILLLIFMSNQFVLYFNRAAAGALPGGIIMKLMMLELPNLMALLLPLGLYIALLLSYGRLYAENEMTVLHASGYSPAQLLGHSLLIASLVAALVASVILWASPYLATERAKLLRTTGIKTLIQTIMPGRFHAMNHDQEVFYVEAMNQDHSKAAHIFLAKQNIVGDQLRWDILWADQASLMFDAHDSEDYLVLSKGHVYQGTPGSADYQVSSFAQYKTRLPHPVIALKEDMRTLKTAALWPFNNVDLEKAAELQWRCSIPLMTFILTILAVPLSRVNARQGKFAKLLPAIVIYLFYANLMFFMRDAIISGALPVWFALSSLHFIVLLIALVLLWRNKVVLG